MLKVNNIDVYYGAIHAIKDVSLEVPDGEIVTLIGSNGAGKSTTLHTIPGLLSLKTAALFLKIKILPVCRRIKLSAWAYARCRKAATYLPI